MCWNATISINTFIVSMFTFILAYQNKIIDFRFLLFGFSFCIMQLIEFFIWKNNPNGPNRNSNMIRIVSMFGLLFIMLQPLASVNKLKEGNDKNIAFILYGIMIIMFILFRLPNINFDTTVAKNGHLQWKWLNLGIFISILWFGLFFYGFKDTHILFFIFALVTVILSFYFYYNDGTISTMWCWIANFISIFILIKLLIIDPFREKTCGLRKH